MRRCATIAAWRPCARAPALVESSRGAANLSDDRGLRRRLGARVVLTPSGPDLAFGESETEAAPDTAARNIAGLPPRPKPAASASAVPSLELVLPLSVAAARKEARKHKTPLTSANAKHVRTAATTVLAKPHAASVGTSAPFKRPPSMSFLDDDTNAVPLALVPGSSAFKDLRTCATVGDWQRCVELVSATWSELGWSDGNFDETRCSPEAKAMFRVVAGDADLGARLLRITAMALSCCSAEATADATGDAAAVDAMAPLIDMVCQLQEHNAACLQPSSPMAAAAIGTIAVIGAACRRIGLHAAVLELDRCIVWPEQLPDEPTATADRAVASESSDSATERTEPVVVGASQRTIFPDGALRRWHAEVFASLDELDVLSRSTEDDAQAAETVSGDDEQHEDAPPASDGAWALALRMLVERGSLRHCAASRPQVRTPVDAPPSASSSLPSAAGVEPAVDVETPVLSSSKSSPARVSAQVGSDPCVVGAASAALVVEMLQRAGQAEQAGALIANRTLLSRRTTSELGQAYASLIAAWTKTPVARRARAEAATAPDTGKAPNLPWWRGAGQPGSTDGHLW